MYDTRIIDGNFFNLQEFTFWDICFKNDNYDFI